MSEDLPFVRKPCLILFMFYISSILDFSACTDMVHKLRARMSVTSSLDITKAAMLEVGGVFV